MMIVKWLLLTVAVSLAIEVDSVLHDYDSTAEGADFVDRHAGPYDDVIILPSHLYGGNQYVVREFDNRPKNSDLTQIFAEGQIRNN